MTPTQAQIDAAVKAMRECGSNDELYYDSEYEAAAKAALTAAAEVMPKNKQRQFKMGYEHGVATTIERCAQVADHFQKINDGDVGDLALISAHIAAAIRALSKESK